MALFLVLKPGEPRRLWFAIIAFFSAVWAWSVAVALGAQAGGGGAVGGAAVLCRDRARRSVRAHFCDRAHQRARALALALDHRLAHRGRGLPRVPVADAGRAASRRRLLAAAVADGAHPGVTSALPLFYGMWLVRHAGRALPPCRRRRQLAWAWAALVLGTLGGLDRQYRLHARLSERLGRPARCRR